MSKIKAGAAVADAGSEESINAETLLREGSFHARLEKARQMRAAALEQAAIDPAGQGRADSTGKPDPYTLNPSRPFAFDGPESLPIRKLYALDSGEPPTERAPLRPKPATAPAAGTPATGAPTQPAPLALALTQPIKDPAGGKAAAEQPAAAQLAIVMAPLSRTSTQPVSAPAPRTATPAPQVSAALPEPLRLTSLERRTPPTPARAPAPKARSPWAGRIAAGFALGLGCGVAVTQLPALSASGFFGTAAEQPVAHAASAQIPPTPAADQTPKIGTLTDVTPVMAVGSLAAGTAAVDGPLAPVGAITEPTTEPTALVLAAALPAPAATATLPGQPAAETAATLSTRAPMPLALAFPVPDATPLPAPVLKAQLVLAKGTAKADSDRIAASLADAGFGSVETGIRPRAQVKSGVFFYSEADKAAASEIAGRLGLKLVDRTGAGEGLPPGTIEIAFRQVDPAKTKTKTKTKTQSARKPAAESVQTVAQAAAAQAAEAAQVQALRAKILKKLK